MHFALPIVDWCLSIYGPSSHRERTYYPGCADGQSVKSWLGRLDESATDVDYRHVGFNVAAYEDPLRKTVRRG